MQAIQVPNARVRLRARGLDPSDTSWRLPGCTARCVLLTARVGDRRYAERLPCHDPLSHEAHGRDGEPTAVQQQALGDRVVRTGGLIIDGRKLTVTVHGEAVCLTPTELWLLCWLSRDLDRTCTGAQLQQSVWQWSDASGQHALRVNIARLRAKLGSERRLLQTVNGIGYRLVAEPPLLGGDR